MNDAKTINQNVLSDVKAMLARLHLAAQRLSGPGDGELVGRAQRIAQAVARVIAICDGDPTSAGTAQQVRSHSPDEIKRMLLEIDAIVAPQRHSDTAPYELRFQALDNVHVQCSTSGLFRILYNLVSNAAAALHHSDVPRIDVFLVEHEARIFLQIGDNGEGFDAAALDNLVCDHDGNLRWRGRPRSGLASVIGLAREFGGHVRLIHNAPTGARLGISLPQMRHVERCLSGVEDLWLQFSSPETEQSAAI